ncbi:hypothetical protein [Marinobacter sp.]|uniref:hypothetical protein n=1 Tax=Marinobacter sp. TaxID=50741 RepID=UPI002B275E77|nr:hypothetical protein [Marinobacter sp.]
MNKIACLLLVFCLLQGCAGTRNSYTSLIEENNDASVLRLNKGDTVELLAIGNGFPGWWGYYPGVISSEPEIASVDCENARSLLPFREPGVLFGGEICNLTAHEKGKTTLYFGNQYVLTVNSYDEKYEVIIVEE